MIEVSDSQMPVITFDGPSGVGKGTMAQVIANELGFHLLDSGAIYRLAALAAIEQQIESDNEAYLVALCEGLDIRFEAAAGGTKVFIFLNNIDVTARIRSEDIAQRASQIAVLGPVRQALLQRQRDFAQEPGLVADGRDMGTVVFPKAQIKFFLTATASVRAKRRFEELLATGQNVEYSHILQEIEARDQRDSQRAVAPLKPAEDAVILDTSAMSITDVKNAVLKILKSAGLKIS